MTYLTQHLPFPSSSSSSSSSSSPALPPPRTHLLISDTLQSQARFAVYHLFASAIAQKRQVVWVDLTGEGRGSVEAVMKKLGTAMPASSAKAFVHISPSSNSDGNDPPLFDHDDQPSLRPTYRSITSHLVEPPSAGSGPGPGPLVILDGLTRLLWVGFSPVDVTRFVRAVIAAVRKTNGSLVSTIHADSLPLTPSSPTPDPSTSPEIDLLERLMRISNLWWRVSELASGRSGDVHGEISCHPLTLIDGGGGGGGWTEVGRNKPLQYRLEERGVKVFPKGTGRGFL